MKTAELENLGIPHGPVMKIAQRGLAAASAAGKSKSEIRTLIRNVVADPTAYTADPFFGELAARLLASPSKAAAFVPRDTPASWQTWGTGLETEAVNQMRRACDLPVAVIGALMPDAHVGYGLPIGGVLATRNAVIPYAVGVDIACRMRLTVLDLPASTVETEHGRTRLAAAIERQTRFGVGASFKTPHQHDVLDADWRVSPITQHNKDRARNQLGTSGSGNHFVEFGMLTVPVEQASRLLSNPVEQASRLLSDSDAPSLNSGSNFSLPPGTYLALLSHSGSRGTGASVCDHYSKLAMSLHTDLPKELKYLAWLDLDSEPGAEYWAAMNLMGFYAAANHEVIHREILRDLGSEAIAMVENHHNFAWKEIHDAGDGLGPQELIVHRKGATPAGAGVLGVIPGSMATPGFVVRGKGQPPSLNSASHGAGRAMSRTAARSTFAWGNVKRELAEKGVTVMSAGIDEVPGVYKDIHAVMAAQQDLVEVIARFDPKLVKMAPEGERAED